MEHPADTHLNTCAVLSQIGRHQGGLEHAQSALILLQEELFGGAGGVGVGGEGGGGGGRPPRADRVAVLAIAYHNMGVEQEFLKKFEHSLQSYRKGVEVRAHACATCHRLTLALSAIACRTKMWLLGSIVLGSIIHQPRTVKYFVQPCVRC